MKYWLRSYANLADIFVSTSHGLRKKKNDKYANFLSFLTCEGFMRLQVLHKLSVLVWFVGTSQKLSTLTVLPTG